MVLFALDADGVFTLSEGKALERLGLEPGEVVGRSVFEVYADDPQIARGRRAPRARGRDGQRAGGDRRARLRRGLLAGGEPATTSAAAVIGVATDVTSRHRSEQELAHFASHDRLTGLANRALLEDALRVRRRAGAARRLRGRAAQPRPRRLQDGQRLARPRGRRRAAVRDRRAPRRARGRTRLLARHGGDEFMLLLEDLPGDGRAVAEAVARELLEELRLPVPPRRRRAAGRRQRRHQPLPRRRARRRRPAQARRRRDVPGQARRPRPARALPRRRRPRHRRLELTARLRAALAGDELELHFQPVYELAAGRPRASRRSCAGTTPSAAWSPRRSSSRSPRTPA